MAHQHQHQHQQQHQRPTALMDTDVLAAAPVCNCHRRRNSLPGPGKHNTVHFSAPGHVAASESAQEDGRPPAHPQSAPLDDEDDGELPQDIPIQYIVDQLHRLGPFYWHKPETTDCTIQVPTDQRRLSRAPNLDLSAGLNTGILNANNLDVRRGSAPATSQSNPTKAFTTLKLHQFYLTSQSSLLRTLFSGSSALGLVAAQNPSMPSTSSASPLFPANASGRRDSTPSLARIPRLLPSSATHPTLYLPLPDPSSFPHIIHYLYFGSPAFLEEALGLGRIRWDGVVRNVEYLGLHEEEGGIGIRRWLMEWRERQRRASIATSGGHASHHVHIRHGTSFPLAGSAAAHPIVVEESSEDSTSDSHPDSEMLDSDEFEDDDDDMYGGEDDEDTGNSSGGDGWDPMVQAIAGMKMVDPFALGERTVAGAPIGLESIDPLHG